MIIKILEIGFYILSAVYLNESRIRQVYSLPSALLIETVGVTVFSGSVFRQKRAADRVP